MKNIFKKLFCSNNWQKTDGYIGDRLREWKCIKCNKKRYQNHFEIPISHLS